MRVQCVAWRVLSWLGVAGASGKYDVPFSLPVSYSEEQGDQPTRTLADLEDALSNIANSQAAKEEAKRIAAAIKYTFEKNWRFYFPRFHDERNKGYYCYEWAYAFEDAFNLESSGKHFKATVEEAVTPDGRVHYWLRIVSLETGQTIYVDDGFMDGSYVHDKRPVGGDYKFSPGTALSDQPRSKSNVPPPYRANGNPGAVTKIIGKNVYGGPVFQTGPNPTFWQRVGDALANQGSGGIN